MSDDLVERVARAIYQSDPEGGYEYNDPRTFWKSADSYWPDEVWSAWEGQALAAIEAMDAWSAMIVAREKKDKANV